MYKFFILKVHDATPKTFKITPNFFLIFCLVYERIINVLKSDFWNIKLLNIIIKIYYYINKL